MLLVLSVLNVLRHSYFFIQAFIMTRRGEPSRYSTDSKQLLIFGISLAFIITSIFTGITF